MLRWSEMLSAFLAVPCKVAVLTAVITLHVVLLAAAAADVWPRAGLGASLAMQLLMSAVAAWKPHADVIAGEIAM